MQTDSTTTRTSGITYQFKGYLTREGHALLDRRLAENRHLYNAALAQRIHAHKFKQLMPGFEVKSVKASQSKQVTRLYQTNPSFGGPRRVKMATLERLDRAYQSFFRRVKTGEAPGFPRFKGRYRFRTLMWHSKYENHVQLDRERGKGYIRPKTKSSIDGMPRIEFKLGSRELPDGQPNEIRITKTPRRVIVSLVYTLDDVPEPFGEPKNPVGIDRGVKYQAVLSTGGSIHGRRINRRKIKRLQRKVSRARRGSKSRRKKVGMLAREWQRVREAERGSLHEVSTEIVKNHDFFAVEGLNLKNMIASAKGTEDKPGKNVAAKSGLNRSILEQNWGRFAQMIAYKAEWAGKWFVEVDPKYTSQACHLCGTIDGASRRSQPEFVCTGCGYAANADYNAAQEILRRGLVETFGPGGAILARAASNFQAAGHGARRNPSAQAGGAKLPGFL